MTSLPVSPSPYQGEGEILKRGTDAPLKHPHIINPEQGERYKKREMLKESQREAKPLLHIPSPFPLPRGRGIKGNGVTR